MEKNNIILKMLPKFLSLFNLNILKEDNNNLNYILKNNGVIVLYDNDFNPVGRIFIDNEEVIVQAIFKDYFISAVGREIKNDAYYYEYVIKGFDSKKEYIGKYVTEKGIKLDDIMVKNSISLFDNGKFISKCSFNTSKNTFKIYNIETNNHVRYINNEFCHRNNGTITEIINNWGNFIYNLSSADNKNITGFSSILNNNRNYNYTDCELEFRKILEKIDEEYFEFIRIEKELFNVFQENLFEKLAYTGLKNFNKKQLKAMLDIDFEKVFDAHKKQK